MRHILPFIVLAVSFAAPALSAPPTPVVLGPTGGVPGDILILDAARSGADFYSWQVTPELPDGRPTIVPLEGGSKCLVCSVPGTYTVFLAVGNSDGIGTAKHTVRVEGNAPHPGPDPRPVPPGPQPGPTPIPAPNLTGLAKSVYDAAVRINDKPTAKALAENYGSLMSAIAAGAYAGDFTAARNRLLTDTVAANSPVVRGKPQWLSLFSGELRQWLDGMDSAGQLGTMPAVQRAYEDIATGFREASK